MPVRRRTIKTMGHSCTRHNVQYIVSDKPMTEEEWAAQCVTEH